MDGEGDTEVSIEPIMNSMAGGVKEEERGQMIGQNPKAGSRSLFVRGNRDKEFSF